MSTFIPSPGDDEDDDEISPPNLSALSEGLSPDTFAALMSFLGPKEEESSAEESPVSPPINKETVCVAYTQKDVNMITDTYKRLAAKSSAAQQKNETAIANRVLLDLQQTVPGTELEVLARLGVIRINNVLSEKLCDDCLREIDDRLENAGSEDEQVDSGGFGNVLQREFRWDMYLRLAGPVQNAIKYMFVTDTTSSDKRQKGADDNESIGSPASGAKAIDGAKSTEKRGQIGELFDELFSGADSKVHELPALISHKGARCQPIHPDTQFTEVCPLYTVFLALQDVDCDMGPTVFLPGTHTREHHATYKVKQVPL